MTENLKKFLEAASGNAEIKDQLNKLSKDELIAKAAELGIELTEADFELKNELSDDELVTVSGGSGGCACPVAGGGGGKDSEDGMTYGCACVAYGQGGDGRVEDANCTCIFGGLGYDNGLAF